MSSLEEEYRKRFGEDREASDDFDAEGLWANIESELGTSSSKPLAGFNWARVSSGALLLIGLSIWFFSQYKWGSTESIEKRLMHSSVEALDSCDQYNVEGLAQGKSDGKTSGVNSLDIASKGAGLPPVDGAENNTMSLDASESQSNLTNTEEENEFEYIDETVSTYEIAELEIDLEDSNLALTTNLNIQEDKKVRAYRELTDRLDLVGFSLKGPSVDLSSPKLSFVEEVLNEKELNGDNGLSFQVFSGINANNVVYVAQDSGYYAGLRRASERSQLGLNSGMNLRYTTKNNWFFGLGIEYQQWRRLLDYESVRQYTELREEQVLTIWLDAFTQDTLAVEIGQGEVDIRETRTIVHNNKYSSFTIPFSLGYQRSNNKLSYGFSAAMNLNFLLSQTGKVLDEEGYSSYMNAQTGMLQDLSIGFRLSPFVEYSLRESLGVFVQGNYDQYLKKDYGVSSGLTGRPALFGFNFGLRYKLRK